MRISDWSSDVCSSDLEPRRAIGAAQLAIHVERHIEHREKNRDLAEDRQVQQSHHDEQQQHERNRVSYEDEMIIGVKAPAERKEQPHEGQRQRDQRTGEFIDRKSTRLTSSHSGEARMPSSACKKKEHITYKRL